MCLRIYMNIYMHKILYIYIYIHENTISTLHINMGKICIYIYTYIIYLCIVYIYIYDTLLQQSLFDYCAGSASSASGGATVRLTNCDQPGISPSSEMMHDSMMSICLDSGVYIIYTAHTYMCII